MFGIINLISIVILFLSFLSCVTDLYRGKIYNWITLPGMSFGLIYSFFFTFYQTSHLGSAFQSLFFSFMGIIVGLFLFGWMFGFGFLGGGDVKLLMAFGAWVGVREVTEIALFSILIGGVFSLFILFFSGGLIQFGKKFYRFLLTLLVKELEVELPLLNKGLKMPFGIPLALSAILTHFFHPLVRWGLLVW